MTEKRSVIFTEPQIKWLRTEAKRIGISIGELLRRLIDEKREPQ